MPIPKPPRREPESLSFAFAAVLPEQLYDAPTRSRENEGMQALMLAILKDALECFRQQFVRPGRRVQRLAREAEQWFFTDDFRWPFSFVNVCAALDIEPEAMRRELQRWRQRGAAGGDALQRREPAGIVQRMLKFAA